MNSRRGFLGAILAAAMAPAVVKASSLMPIYVPKLWLPTDVGAGDFTAEAWFHLDASKMDEIRITKGAARYSIGANAIPSNEWSHIVLTSAGLKERGAP